jgi:hypothetical protein
MHEPRVVADEAENVPRVLVNHSPKIDGTLHLLFCYVRQLVIRVDHLRCPPTH